MIGGGAIGVTTALELARAGASVAVIEKEHELGLGCSRGTAGLLAPSHAATLAVPQALRDGLRWMTRPDSPFYIRPRLQVIPWLLRFTRAALDPAQAERATALLRTLSSDSLRLHVDLAEIGTSLERRGVLYAYETEAGFEHARAALPAARTLGLRVRALAPEEARAVEPAIAEDVAGAVYCEDEGHLDSLCYVQSIGEAAAKAGARLRLGTEALRFRTSGARIATVETTAGPLTADTVILAAGVWSRQLGAELGLTLPLEAAKGYHIDLAAADGDPHIPVYMHESKVIATPYPDRLRLAGTLELSGLDASVDPVRLDALKTAARRNLASLDSRPVVSVWRGFRPTPPDGLPLLGRTRHFGNLIVATGHAMTGVALAPVTAKIVRRLVDGEPPGYDMSCLAPDRFARSRARRHRSPPMSPTPTPR